jgi:hypothetical protein
MAKDGSAVPSSPLDDLRLALAQADDRLAAADAPEQKRIVVLLALKAIYEFLKSGGLRSRALNNLSMALQDVERGYAALLFAPRTKNRPRDSTKLFILKASSAAAMQLLIDSGKSKSESKAVVARKLTAAGFPTDAGTVARWRDKFSGHSSEEGADTYRFVLQEARASYTTPAHQAEAIMRGLKRLVGNLDKSPS